MLCARTSGREANTSASGWLAVEVRDQQFDAAAGNGTVDLHAGVPVQPGSAVGQVIAGDAGHGRVPQAHRRNRLGNPAGLVGVKQARLAGGDLAEVAPPRALVAADQEGGFPVLPAFEDVGAASLLANRVQPSCLTSCCSSVNCGPVRSLVLIHGGLRSIGVWLFRASTRSSRRSPGASATVLAYVGGVTVYECHSHHLLAR